MSDFEHPPYVDHIAVPGPAEEIGSGPAVWPAPGTTTDVLPAAEPGPPARRTGRTVVAATLAVLLVLVVGGAAYGWTVLQRPDVKLARAFDATRSAAQGSMRLSLTATGKAAVGSESITRSSLRYAWAPGTQQFTVVYDGRKLGTVTTTSTHVTLQVDPTAIPNASEITDNLAMAGAVLGDGADVITALLDGKPVGIAVGPGSALQKALDKAATSSGYAAAAEPVPGAGREGRRRHHPERQGQRHRHRRRQRPVRRPHRRHRSAGQGRGRRLVLDVLPRPRLLGARSRTSRSSPRSRCRSTSGSRTAPSPASRSRCRRRSPTSRPTAGQSDVTLVVVMSSDGVEPVQGPVTEVPDSLLDSLTGAG